ncbi:MAG: peroxiredoxin [Roseovarius sp.]
MLNPGDEAPDFTLPRDGGGLISLSALRPAPVVLYFYPRDDTSGCTREARDFTALAAEFEAAGARVLGVSRDSVQSHERFRDKHGLGVTLLSAADSDLCERYGVWTRKSMYGRSFFGIERTTFLIDGSGRIVRIWRKVRLPGHAEEVLGAVRELAGGAAGGGPTDPQRGARAAGGALTDPSR